MTPTLPRRLILSAVAAIALALPVSALADPAHDAAARYVAWRGGKAFEQATGILMRGATDDGRFKGLAERRMEPGRTMERVSFGSAGTHQASIGSGGWAVSLSGQVEDVDTATAEQAARRRLVMFDDAFRDPSVKLTLAPDETFDGQAVQVLRVTFDPRNRYELLLSPTTGALVADRTTDDGVTTVVRYADWRTVEGVKVAFRETAQTEDDKLVTTITLTEVDLNPRRDDKAFARPAPRRVHAFLDGRTATDPLAFELYLGSRIYIPATVNGTETHVLLDSGAETTVLDKAFAESLGIKPTAQVAAVGTGGRDVAELARGVTVRVRSVELRDMTVAILDLKPIAAAIGRPLPVILGKEVLNDLTVDLDFVGKTIAFHDPDSYRPPAGAVPVPVTTIDGLHAIPVSVEGGEPVLMDFDLGNGGALLVYPGYWRPHGMLAERPSSKVLSGAVGGVKPRDIAVVRSLTLAGVTFRDIPTVFGGDDNSALGRTKTNGNVGMGILSRFSLTTDYARKRLLLTPRASAVAAPFPKDRTGLSARPSANGTMTVAFIAPGSPAEAAGLKAGQVIDTINGKAAGEVGAAGLSLLRTAAAGETLTLGLATGETIPLTLKDFY